MELSIDFVSLELRRDSKLFRRTILLRNIKRISEEVHVILWDIGDLDVFLEGHVKLLKLLGKSLEFSGLAEGLESSADRFGLGGGGGFLPGGIVGFVPLGSLEHFPLVLDIIGLILDDLNTLVVYVDAIWGLLDVILKGIVEVLHLVEELLTLWGSPEFLVEGLDGGDLIGFGPSLDGVLEVSDGSGHLDGFSSSANIVEFLLDLSLSSLGDGDLKKSKLVIDLLWKISDLDVGLEGKIELLKLLGKSLPLSRLGEGLESSSERLGLWGSGGLLPGGIVGFLPLGSLEHLVLVLDIIGLVLDDLDTLVVDVDTVLGLLDVLLKGLTEVLPLSHELLTLWGGKEFLVEGLDGLDLIGMSPSLEGAFEVSDGSGILDLVHGLTNIVEFLLDGSLSLWGDGDLEEVLLILPVVWDIGDLDVLLDLVLDVNDFLVESLTLIGVSEGLDSSDELLSVLGLEGSLPSSLVGLVPLGAIELLVLVGNIAELIGEFIHVLIWEVDTVLVVVEVLIKDVSNIHPLVNELLTLWGSHESLVNLLDVGDLLGHGELLEGVLEVSGRSGVLDRLGGLLNIGDFLLDLSLAGLGDSDLEEVNLVLEVFELRGADDTEEKGKGEFHF